MLTQFATLEDVPAQHIDVCVEAFSQVLQKMEEAEELGVLVGRISKQLALAAVRTQAECLITRMSNVGEGAGAVGKRKQMVIRWKRRWDMEMVCERQGRRILRIQ